MLTSILMNSFYNNHFHNNYLKPTNNAVKNLIEEKKTYTFYDKKLHDYCLKSTLDSVKKIIKKHSEERKHTIDCFDLQIKNKQYGFKPDNTVFPFFLFLSASSFYLYFMYNKNK